MSILLVEDNYSIASALEIALKRTGYVFYHASSFKEGVNFLKDNLVSLIILDVTLPDGSGFDLYSDFIKEKNIPTLFLTARDEEDYIVHGLEIGAEDYVTKPFLMNELLIRISKILSRSKSVIKVSDIVYDMGKMCVYKNGEVISFSTIEIKILNVLFLNINKVVSREMLIELIWEATGNDVYDHTITVYLKRIRNKLGTDIIKTVKGIVYRIDE